MTTRDTCRTLLAYRRWADETLFEALAALDPALLTAPRPIVFGSILQTLDHVRIMDEVWRAHLAGEDHGHRSRNPAAGPTLPEIVDAQRRVHVWFADYAASLAPVAFDERVHFDWIDGGRGDLTRAQILLHVANHGTYHRGHVAALLYATGVSPPTTDLPVFQRHCSEALDTGAP